jgi:hypothetical protein
MARTDQPLTEVFRRYWSILTMLPLGLPGATTPQLFARLPKGEPRLTLRTLQRDLQALHRAFPNGVRANTGTKPYRWYWDKDAPLLQCPAMDPQAALAFRLLEEHLPALVPPGAESPLSRYFAAARAVLEELEAAE